MQHDLRGALATPTDSSTSDGASMLEIERSTIFPPRSTLRFPRGGCLRSHETLSSFGASVHDGWLDHAVSYAKEIL